MNEKKLPADKNFLVTNTELPGEPIDDLTLADVAHEVKRIFDQYKQTRQDLESDWLDCWAHYFGNSRSQDHLRQAASKIVGDVNDDWRHRVGTGKGFENVETICGYFHSATFPNKEWFAMTPTEPGYADIVKPVEKYLQQKLEASRFQSAWDMFVRQAVILGTSVLALPWRVETIKHLRRVPIRKPVVGQFGEVVGESEHFEIKSEDRLIHSGPDFEVLDMFDVFLDPLATDPNNSNLIRRMKKTKAEVLHLIDDGFYPHGSKYHIIECKGVTTTPDESESNKDTVRMFGGLEYQPNEQVELIEFWGDLSLQGKTYHNIVVTLCGGTVMRFEQNPYWYGKPFIVATYTPVNRQVYGIGALQPTLGLLHEMNILTNQRLDNLELGVDQMWTFVPDGTMSKDEIFTKPGHVFEVSSHDSLQPVARGDIGKLSITYQESTFLETRIDKATGTGAFISAGAGRSGERVTATEVQAQRDAGGNRLSSRHQHIEDTALIPCLAKLYRGCQQFIDKDSIVRMPSRVPGQHLYAQVGPNELIYDFQFSVQGATYIADEEFELNKWLNFLQVVGGNPQLAPQINWPILLEKLVIKFGLDEVESLILPPQPPAPPPGMMPPEAPPVDPMQEELMAMGGQGMVDAVRSKAMTGQLPAALAKIYKSSTPGLTNDPNDPNAQAAIAQMLQTQGL